MSCATATKNTKSPKEQPNSSIEQSNNVVNESEPIIKTLPGTPVVAPTENEQGQTFKQQLSGLLSKKDTLGVQQLLGKWEKADSNDPELYVAYFNYYANSSRKEVISIGQNPSGDYSFALMEKDSSKKEPAGYLSGELYYDQDILKKAFGYIDKGIEKHPNRLDMRFGKIYILGQVKDYENFTTNIIKTVEYSAINKNKWTWTDSQPLDNPQEFMLGSIQSYQLQLYNTLNDSLLDNMKRIAETILKFYPDNIESLSNLSVVFMIQKQYDKAINILLKAEKINPKDYVILGNIAEAYRRQNDTKNAIKYYELLLKYGDERAKADAKRQLSELENSSK